MLVAPVDDFIYAMGLIQLDASLFLQLGIFLSLMFVLDRLLFRPALETLALREERTTGARKEAALLKSDADEKLAAYEESIRQARLEATEARKLLRSEGTAREEEILGAVRAETQKELAAAQQDLAAAAAEAHKGIEAAAGDLSKVIVRRLIGGGAVVLLLCLPAGEAWAGGSGSSGFPWKDVGFLAFNGAVLLWIVVKMGRAPLGDFLKKRKADLVSDLDEAARLREEARTMLADYEQRIAALDSEREEILARFRSDGENEKQRIITEAEAAAVKLREDTKRLIAGEIRKTRIGLEGQILDQAIERAMDTLRQDVDEKKHNKLVDAYVQRIKEPSAGPGAAA